MACNTELPPDDRITIITWKNETHGKYNTWEIQYITTQTIIL